MRTFLVPRSDYRIEDNWHTMGLRGTGSKDVVVDGAFVRDIKAGKDRVASPVYSHVLYDIVPGEAIVVERPDIVIVEGLNVLQTSPVAEGAPRVFVSDYFDFTIYVDADAHDIRSWYVERFLALRHTAFRDPAAYFHRYAGLSDAEAAATAERIWADINEPNLVANILPTRERADLVLRARPVLGAEGVERERRDPDAARGARHGAYGLGALAVARHAGEAARLGPAAVPVHDDGDVARQGPRLHARFQLLDEGPLLHARAYSTPTRCGGAHAGGPGHGRPDGRGPTSPV